jgi:hypothetical protein
MSTLNDHANDHLYLSTIHNADRTSSHTPTTLQLVETISSNLAAKSNQFHTLSQLSQADTTTIYQILPESFKVQQAALREHVPIGHTATTKFVFFEDRQACLCKLGKEMFRKLARNPQSR